MNPKKKPPAKPDPEPEPDEPPESTDNRDEDQPEPEARGHRPPEDTPDLKIVVKQDVVEIDLPRDGNETDTLERIAALLDDSDATVSRNSYDVVPRRLLELCKDTLRRCLAGHIQQQRDLEQTEAENQKLKRILDQRKP